MTERPLTTRGERAIYEGRVCHDDGEHLADIEGEAGGYAPLVTLKVAVRGGEVTLWMSPKGAKNMGEHLIKAAREVEANA